MDGYGSSSGAGGGGFPIRNSGGGSGGIMPGAERVAQPLAQYANTNGVASRPRGGGGEDGFVGGGGGGGGGGGRAQQPSHEVFMVREASRGSLHASQSQESRQSFATSGNRFQTESGGESEQRQVLPVQQSNSSSHSNGHHRHRSERDRDKERDHQQPKQFPLPKMLKIAVVGESTSGKTAICNAFTSEGYNFSRNYHMPETNIRRHIQEKQQLRKKRTRVQESQE